MDSPVDMNILQKRHRTRDKNDDFVRFAGAHTPSANASKVMHKRMRGCCTASSFSISAPLISSTIKSTFKISCAQNVPKFLFFTKKCAQKRLRGNLHEALFFNGREGGIRTHGGSSPHLISSLLFCFLEHMHFVRLLVYEGNIFCVWLDMTSSNHRI